MIGATIIIVEIALESKVAKIDTLVLVLYASSPYT